MAQSIYIQITKRGMATGPFTIYWDNFNNIVEQNVKASTLDAGYTVSVPDAAQYIVLENMDPCGQNSNFRNIIPLSPTPSPSITPSFSITPSVSISATPSISVTPSITVTVTPSATPSVSITATPSISVTPSVSVTPSISVTPASSVTPSVSVTPSITVTPSVSVTPSITVSTTPSVSITATPSISLTPGVSTSSTPSASVTPSVSITRTPSASVTPSVSITRTPSASVTPSVSITRTPSASVTPSVSITRTPSASVTPSVSITRTPSESATPSVSISNTPSISISRTPSITPSRTPAIIQQFRYSNQEYSDGTVFLDGDLILNQNGSSFLPVGNTPGTFPVYFPTPGEVIYTGTTIYQDDSIYVQASGNTATYPAPGYGTATRTLHVYDSANNTIINTTVNYTSSLNATFAAVGGRTYYALASTNFSWPAYATLTIAGMFLNNMTNKYNFICSLDTAVDGDFTISTPGGLSGDVYFGAGCPFPPDTTLINNVSSTVTKGQYGSFNVATNEDGAGFVSYELQNAVYINGVGLLFSGQQFVRGATTVTIDVITGCQPF